MPICPQNCAQVLPPLSQSCRPKVRRTGIDRFVFIDCQVAGDFEDNVQDELWWQEQAEACKIRITNSLRTTKDQGDATEERYSTCGTTTTTTMSRTITFQDYFHDPETNLQRDFWNFLLENQSDIFFGYITCDGYFYGITEFGIVVDEIFPEDGSAPYYIDGQINWDGLTMLPQYNLPFLKTTLINAQNTNCTDPYGQGN